ncbi:cation diffusion facilitator family transporter [Dehalobacter restrictus]|uniref:Cation diffusion facilitator family transporter n=1 Tax=Dehalobacter restrictus TaxID=55583 RepID=A0A857DG20_9FIRM|nr:cation diffusion facilitator family transporter [Dehalobacter restrictus]QGZ99224.1 cation diffusion facilitator family transporter [Dehalobacter restrictus]
MEESEKVALLAVAMNLALFGIKYGAALATGSIALKAEAFHSLADLVASLTVFAGLKLSKRKTKAFPYGLYKIENLISVCIALIIFYAGYEVVMEVMTTTPTELKNSGIAISVLLIAMLITFCFSKYEKKISRKINSPVLLADAAHIRTDVLSNAIVLVAVVSGLFGFQFDKIAALIVVVFIAKTGIEILIGGARVLLDASVDYETLSKVEKIILETPQVVELKTLTGRNSGRYKFIEADIVLKTHDLDRAHSIADSIERNVKNEIKHIEQVLIHYEPQQNETMIYALPLSGDRESISPHFGEAPYFMLVTFNAGTKAADKVEILKNPYTNIEKSKGILAAELLVKNRVDFVLVKTNFDSKGPHYVFSNADIEVIITDEELPELAFEKLGLTVNLYLSEKE